MSATVRARMQEKYCSNWADRPAQIDDCDDASCRTFLCGRCRTRVFICSHCDRGHVYCFGGCARTARRQAQRDAGRRYQRSRDGRFAHAERSRRYRARRKIVTHHGSPRPPDDGLVGTDRTVAARGPQLMTGGSAATYCHRCGRRCSALVRQVLLRHRRRVPRPRHDRRGTDRRDHFP